MATIPQKYQDLLSDEKKALASLATLQPDGTPQVTPVWFDVVDGKIRVNTAKHQVKYRNMTANGDWGGEELGEAQLARGPHVVLP